MKDALLKLHEKVNYSGEKSEGVIHGIAQYATKEIKKDKKPKYKYADIFNDSVLSLSDKEINDFIKKQGNNIISKLIKNKDLPKAKHNYLETKHKAKFKKRHKSKLV